MAAPSPPAPRLANPIPHALTGPPDLPRKLYTLVVIHQDPVSAAAGPAGAPTSTSAARPSPSCSAITAPGGSTRRRVLLGRKLRGFGAGYFNGYGGKVEPGEGVAAAAARELTEEACIVATDLHRRGILTFSWVDQPGDPAWEVHVFGCTEYEGLPTETDEMAPRWFDVELVAAGGAGQPPLSVTGLPFDRMWADDPAWYPLMLGGEGLFMGAFQFRNVTELVGGEVGAVEALPPLPR